VLRVLFGGRQVDLPTVSLGGDGVPPKAGWAVRPGGGAVVRWPAPAALASAAVGAPVVLTRGADAPRAVHIRTITVDVAAADLADTVSAAPAGAAVLVAPRESAWVVVVAS
jgi:hypothetical protein